MNAGVGVAGWRDGFLEGRRRTGFLVGLVLLVVAGSVVATLDGGTSRLRSDDDSATGAVRLSDAAKGAGGSGAVPGAAAAASAGGAAVAGGQASGAGGSEPAPAVPPGTPQVVRTAELRVEVPKGRFGEAVDRANGVAVGLGGFVVSSSTSSFEAGQASGDVTLRVPVNRFDAARRQLAELGKVTSLQVAGQDVTGQLVDLDARLRALRAEESALTALLGRAGNVGEVLQVRGQLSGTRTQIEQLAAQQKQLGDQAAFSTLRVTLAEKGVVANEPERRTGLARSLRRAGNAFVAVVGGMVVVAAALAPFVLVAGVAALGVKVLRRRRPAERAL